MRDAVNRHDRQVKSVPEPKDDVDYAEQAAMMIVAQCTDGEKKMLKAALKADIQDAVKAVPASATTGVLEACRCLAVLRNPIPHHKWRQILSPLLSYLVPEGELQLADASGATTKHIGSIVESIMISDKQSGAYGVFRLGDLLNHEEVLSDGMRFMTASSMYMSAIGYILLVKPANIRKHRCQSLNSQIAGLLVECDYRTTTGIEFVKFHMPWAKAIEQVSNWGIDGNPDRVEEIARSLDATTIRTVANNMAAAVNFFKCAVSAPGLADGKLAEVTKYLYIRTTMEALFDKCQAGHYFTTYLSSQMWDKTWEL